MVEGRVHAFVLSERSARASETSQADPRYLLRSARLYLASRFFLQEQRESRQACVQVEIVRRSLEERRRARASFAPHPLGARSLFALVSLSLSPPGHARHSTEVQDARCATQLPVQPPHTVARLSQGLLLADSVTSSLNLVHLSLDEHGDALRGTRWCLSSVRPALSAPPPLPHQLTSLPLAASSARPTRPSAPSSLSSPATRSILDHQLHRLRCRSSVPASSRHNASPPTSPPRTSVSSFSRLLLPSCQR